MWLVHAGNRIDAPDRDRPRFPAANVPVVEARLRRFLDALRPASVVSAPAAGSDLLVLDVACDIGLRTEVVLPLPEAQFVDESIADQGADWMRRFRRVREHAEIHQSDLSDDPEWYLAGNRLILDVAARLIADHGDPDEGLLALAVRPPDDTDSVTAEFIHEAHARGITTIDIDPSTRPRRRAFVAMPFGRKRDPSRDVMIDCDETFRKLIVPALEDADLNWTRADRAVDAGLIHVGMINDLATTDLVLADLTLENPNVCYEVGLRHVFRGRATVLMHREGGAAIFDLRPLREFRYPLAHAAITDTEALGAIPGLRNVLAQALADTSAPDSPVHTLFDVSGVRITPRHPTSAMEQFNDLAGQVDAIERAARRPDGLNEEARTARDNLRRQIDDLDLDDESRRALLLRLGIALRDAGQYEEALETLTMRRPGTDAPDLPDNLREQAMCHRRLAEATARSGGDPEPGWRRATELLDDLIETGRADADAYGVAGGMSKRRALRDLQAGRPVAAAAHLRETARYYADGSELDATDYYLHLNVVTSHRLLGVHFGDADATERCRQRLPVALHFARRASDADPTDAYAAASVGELELTAYLLGHGDDHATATVHWYATAARRTSHDQAVAMSDQLDIYRQLDGDLPILDELRRTLTR